MPLRYGLVQGFKSLRSHRVDQEADARNIAAWTSTARAQCRFRAMCGLRAPQHEKSWLDYLVGRE